MEQITAKGYKLQLMASANEFIKLVSLKQAKADQNFTIKKELDTLTMFYDLIDKMVEQADMEIHLLKLERIKADATVKLLMQQWEDELRKKVESSAKHHEKKKPSQLEMDMLRSRSKKGTLKIHEACEYYILSNVEIKQLIDGDT